MANTENIKGIIYKATNLITNETYIGATTKSIEERKNDHIQKSDKGKGYKFHNAISTYGADSFRWNQLDTASGIDELASKEIKYISEYHAFENGLNSDKGGGIKKTIYQYNLDGTLKDTFEDLTSASNAIGVRKQDISRACWNVSNTLGRFFWSYNYQELFSPQTDSRKKEVIQYSLGGNKLALYVSASEASRKTGISKTCITRCCRGERDQTGGFLWRYS